MSVSGPFDIDDAWRHDPLGDDSGWSVVGDDATDCAPESINIFALYGEDLEAVTLEGLADFVALEILGGMTSNGYVVIVDKELYVEALRDSETSSFCVVSFLLRTIRTQTEDGLVLVRYGDTVDERPRRRLGSCKARCRRDTYHMCPRRPEENFTPGVRPSSG